MYVGVDGPLWKIAFMENARNSLGWIVLGCVGWYVVVCGVCKFAEDGW